VSCSQAPGKKITRTGRHHYCRRRHDTKCILFNFYAGF
jgi:hypothetical protein